MIRKYGCVIFALFMIIGIVGCKQEEKPAEKPAGEVKHEVHWGYEGEGAPANWGNLKPEFALCGTGQSQSPIDIEKTYKTALEPVGFSYKESPLKIINNGHAVQVNVEPGSSAMIDGEKYELLQFHFHAPSEHTVKGNFYDMEMHLVHKHENGDLAVVGVMLKKGQTNKIIQVLWDNLPKEVNMENVVSGISVDATGLLPKDRSAFHYYGSLTTPPCSEGVNWTVLKTPIEVSEEQIQMFQALMGVANNRPVQAVNKRFVLESK